MKSPLLRRGRAAFTLIEVLVVITIIGALFALVLGGFTYAERSSKRNVSRVRLDVLRSGLEAYKDEVGEYPEVAQQGDNIEVVGKTYEVSGAAMLYQVMSGDGDDYIEMKQHEWGKSDGKLETQGDKDEAKNIVMKSGLPKDMWTNANDHYYVIDGFGRPFQYVKAVDVDPNAPAAPDARTVNNTFDVWSYGEDVENTSARSVDTLNDSKLRDDAVKWIKNW